MKKVILIKFGGGLITDKSRQDVYMPNVVKRLGNQLKAFKDKNKNIRLILVNGVGSFAHIPAVKYKTKDGFKDVIGKFGACVTKDAAARINLLVVNSLLKLKLPVSSMPPSAIFATQNKVVVKSFLEPLLNLLEQDVIPILYGDVIWDTQQGSTIFSGEDSLRLVSEFLIEHQWKVVKVIQCSIEGGVYDSDGKVITRIDMENFGSVKDSVMGSKAIDVTGGMLHKVEISLKLARLGIRTEIINGGKSGLLLAALEDQRRVGTLIA